MSAMDAATAAILPNDVAQFARIELFGVAPAYQKLALSYKEYESGGL